MDAGFGGFCRKESTDPGVDIGVSLLQSRYVQRFILAGLWLGLWQLPLEGALYRDPVGAFTFEYDEAQWRVVPRDKEVVGQKGSDTAYTAVTLERLVADDNYKARFSVVIDETKPSESSVDPMENYHKKTEEFLKGQRFKILKPGPLTKVANLPAYETLASHLGLLYRQINFLHGGKVFLITNAALEANYPAYTAQWDRMVGSFKFDEK